MIDTYDKNSPRLRDIKVKVSDKDLDELAVICGSAGFTIQDLFETLIGDLTGGHKYSGSDEGDLADKWMMRHYWTTDSDYEPLLKYVVNRHGVEGVEDLLEALDTKKQYEADPDKYAKDMGLGDTVIREWWNDDIKNLTDGYEGPIDNAAINDLSTWLKAYQKISI